MQCIQCQFEYPEGTKFCPECGQRVAEMQPVADETPELLPAAEPEAEDAVAVLSDNLPVVPEPPPTAAVAPPPVAPPRIAPPTITPPAYAPGDASPAHVVEPPPPVKKRKRHGCLITFGVFLLLIGLAAAVLFDLPMRLGLVSSPAEKMFGGSHNRAAAALLINEFELAKQPAKGISVFVLPYKGRGYSLAYVVLDQSKGYQYVDTGFEDPVFAAFQIVARSQAVQQAQIYRVAVEFREADGATLSVLTVPVFAIQQYAAKTIDKKQFIAKMDGHANLARMYKDQYTWLGGPQ